MGRALTETLCIAVAFENGETQEFRFAKSSIIIGRASGSDVSLDAEGISRYHARITVDEGVVWVHDLESTNGTFIGSQRIDKQIIDAADKVSIGNTVYLGSPRGRRGGAGQGADNDCREKRSRFVQ